MNQHHIPCKHETGEVREARIDDHHPLTRDEIASLLLTASKSDDPVEVASIQVRLNQGIPGMKCPREIEGEVSRRMNQMDELYVQLYQNNRAEMPNSSTVERFYQILNGQDEITFRAGDFLKVHVPNELPDPKDLPFKWLKGETFRIVKVYDRYIECEIVIAVHHQVSNKIFIPLKYKPYFETIRFDDERSEHPL